MNLLLKNFFNCFQIAFKASALYTVFRMVSKAIIPILIIISSWNMRNILNSLTNFGDMRNQTQIVFTLFFFNVIITITQIVVSKISGYIENMHQQIIGHYMEKALISKALNSSYSLFDDPQYYDKLNLAANDSYAFGTLFWYLFDCISNSISIAISFTMLSTYSFTFAVAAVVLTIPTAIVSIRYTKKAFKLDKEQVNEVRNLNYTYSLSTERGFAPLIRHYNLQKYFLNRFTNLWNGVFCKKRVTIQSPGTADEQKHGLWHPK